MQIFFVTTNTANGPQFKQRAFYTTPMCFIIIGGTGIKKRIFLEEHFNATSAIEKSTFEAQLRGTKLFGSYSHTQSSQKLTLVHFLQSPSW